MNGFLIANKPTGITSSNLVIFVRKRLPRGTSVGHGGTLDPDASGVLPICIGSATRLFDYIIDKQKTYVADLQLGVETDTQDATGEIVRRSAVSVGRNAVEEVVREFVGEIEQIPPMYSALKQGGKRLYTLARQGEVVERQARRCRIDGIRLLDEIAENRYRIEVDCGKGVYIRTLCHDIGNRLGCGGHMAALMRTKAGVFTLENAYTREQIDALYADNSLESVLLPLDAPLVSMPMIALSENARHAVVNGNVLKANWLDSTYQEGTLVRLYLGKSFAGIGEMLCDGTVRFRAMLLSEEEKHAYLSKRRGI